MSIRTYREKVSESTSCGSCKENEKFFKKAYVYPQVVAIKIFQRHLHVWSTENAFKDASALFFFNSAMASVNAKADAFKTDWKNGKQTSTGPEGISGENMDKIVKNCNLYLQGNSQYVHSETGIGSQAFWFFSDPRAKEKAAKISEGSSLVVYSTASAVDSSPLVMASNPRLLYNKGPENEIKVSPTSRVRKLDTAA
jgi:hypothetical protein